MKDAVVGSKAAFFDDRRRRDDVFARSNRFTNFADIFVALESRVEEFAISRRRLFTDGEGTMNLRRVTPVADRQLGDDHAAFFEHARGLLLPRYEPVGIVHVRCGDKVNARIAAVFDVSIVHDRQYVLFSQAGPQIFFQRLAREVGEIAALTKVHEFFFTAHATDAAKLRTELDELSFGKLTLQ